MPQLLGQACPGTKLSLVGVGPLVANEVNFAALAKNHSSSTLSQRQITSHQNGTLSPADNYDARRDDVQYAELMN